MVRRTGALVMVLVSVLVALAWSGSSAAEEFPTIDGLYSGTGALQAGQTFDLPVTGRGGVPRDGVAAVAVNVAVTNPTGPSFLTVFPTGEARPTSANLNFAPGQTISNMAVVKVGAGGQISLFNYGGSVDVVVDVLGWFPTGPAMTALNPARLADTRPGSPTIDGTAAGGGQVGAGSSFDLQIAGRGGVPAGAGAVALNVAVANPTASSFLTVWPTGQPRPTAASLNYVAGQVVSNMVIVKLGDVGRISLFNYAGGTDVIVDVLAWFPDNGAFRGVGPARVMDTRPQHPTIDNGFAGGGRVGPNSVVDLQVAGRGGTPGSGVRAVALNVAVTNPSAASFLTVWPTGRPRPTAANLNFVAGQTVSNMVLVEVGASGHVSIYNLSGETDIVVDVLGWLPANGTFGGLTPARLMDSRGRAQDVLPPAEETTVPPATNPPGAPVFTIFNGSDAPWDGRPLTFGTFGLAQPDVNVLGRVSDPDGVAALTYSVNGGAPVRMGMGSTSCAVGISCTRRLAADGDFNADIDAGFLAPGSNVVTLNATDTTGVTAVLDVPLLVTKGTVWPLPFTAAWGSVSNVYEVGQPVDGRWVVRGGALRTAEIGYDRLMAVGDRSWGSFEAEVPVVIHGYDPRGDAPPSGGAAVGFITHWNGHTPAGDAQPKYGFRGQFGAVVWYRPSGQLEMRNMNTTLIASSRRTLQIGVPYIFKLRALVRPGSPPTYRFKVFPQGAPEPTKWDLARSTPAGTPDRGSLLLVAHHVDASFGTLTVRTLPQAADADTAL